ncbi:helix-turn-helix domain-containing protein [Burkholderia cenocepacia]|uniref:IclR family transcriptional regulator domain-containing protein n=1 Tax=Burkholderia cenocepacia TaxID=95486 RepID=UPI00222F5D4B|nr:IclR family transcriptional regulator C-terminal domain-containing protein [Burkholderia cenocepacia]MCW3662565.1 helix-turn-helix domain-containing protein [Burkholderia cenocepacia]
MEIEKRDLMDGLLRGLAVVEAFSDMQRRLTPADAAEIVGISRAAARRCLLTLVAGGYASFDGKFFSLTPKSLGLGRAYLAMTPLASALQPYTKTMSTRFNEPCTAAILDGADVIYIARAQPGRVMTVNLGVGARLPAFCTSLGRAMLAYQPQEWLDEFWGRAVLERRTPYTLVSRRAIEAELEATRCKGFALVDQEVEVGLRSLAVPLWGTDSVVRASLTVTTSIETMSRQQMEDKILPELLRIQRAVRHINDLA